MEQPSVPNRAFLDGKQVASSSPSRPASCVSKPPGTQRLRQWVAEEDQSIEKLGRAEGTLAEWGRVFYSWFEDNPLPIMAYDRGNLAILAVNQAAVRQYGYSREEFLTKTIRDIRPPEDVRHLLEALGAGDHGFSGPFQGRHRKKDGTLFDVEVYSQRQAVGSRTIVIAQIRDLTERNRAEQALHRSEEQLQMLVESVTDYAIFQLDPDGRVSSWNSGAERIKGYKAEEIIRQHFSCFYLAEDIERGRPEQELHRAESQGRAEDEGWRVRKDGSRFWANAVIAPIRGQNGQLLGFVKVTRDFTARKQAEEALLLELSGALLASYEVDKLLAAFSAGIRQLVPHDFATLALHEPETDTLRLQMIDLVYQKQMPPGETVVPVEGSPQGLAFRERSPLVLNLLEKHAFKPEALQHLLRAGLRCACWLPLVGRDRALGILAVASQLDSAFAEKDVAILGQVAKHVALALDNALALRRLAELRDRLNMERRYLEEELRTEYNFGDIVGASAGLKGVLNQVETVARTDATVLILGETGTGKELIARAIHELSSRNERTFVKLNCAAVPAGLLESELFGHEKGAFTGAIAQKIGLMELAHRGTLFLDEIGDLPLELQPKLLRALQEREFQRLGGTRTLPVDVRLVAATNHDLAKMVADHQFRIDLYYRLKVFPITLPPLRERADDIPVLVRHFVLRHSRRMGKRIETIPSEVMHALTRWRWPGNVRELENFIERAVILSSGPVLHAPVSELELPGEETPEAHPENTLEAAERRQIIQTLRETRGMIGGPRGAAVRLGVKRTTLNAKIRKLGINPRDYI